MVPCTAALYFPFHVYHFPFHSRSGGARWVCVASLKIATAAGKITARFSH